MRRRSLLVLIAVVAVAAILVGIVTSRAQGQTSLPGIGAQQLLHNVTVNAGKTTAMNGDFAWNNGLLGSSSLLALSGSNTPSGLSSLLQGLSGRLWLQDGRLRLESQGQNGDFIAIVAGTAAWTWDSMTSTATKYTLPAPAAGAATPLPSPSLRVDPATTIANLVKKLAPTASLSVSGTEVVAGQEAYVLKLTPVSPLTTVGSIEVAIDGSRWVPLRVQVFAKGSSKPVLSVGFTSVSYTPASASLFTFTPPRGATVVQKDLNRTQSVRGPQSGAAMDVAKHGPLTLVQAKSAAPFLLTPASTPAGLGFGGAFVASRSAQGGSRTTATHPTTAVLHYGTGFGSVLVVETPAGATQDHKIAQQLGMLSMVGKTSVDGLPATKLQTSLGSALTFTRGGVRIVVVGLVPFSDIAQIAGSLN